MVLMDRLRIAAPELLPHACFFYYVIAANAEAPENDRVFIKKRLFALKGAPAGARAPA
jgi:hypothetical protein